MKILTLIFCLNGFVATATATLPRQVQVSKASDVKLNIKSLKAPEKKLLKEQTLSIMQYVEAYFDLPDSIFMANGPTGPEYNEGFISLRFPFYASDPEGKEFYKSLEDSLAINLHEVIHNIFEKTITESFQKKPDVIWAFFARDDRNAGLSLEFIEKTKGLTKYKNVDSELLRQKFLDQSRIGVYYNELFADTVVAFYQKDPDAIYKSVHFIELENSNDSTTSDFQKSHRARRFNQPHDMNIADESRDSDPYAVLAPSRQLIWQKVFVDFQKRNPQVPSGLIMQRLLRVYVYSFIESTGDFSKKSETVSTENLNSVLQKNILAEFIQD